jgi:hypothetical protein
VERTAYDASGFPALAAYGALAQSLRSGDGERVARELSSTEFPPSAEPQPRASA